LAQLEGAAGAPVDVIPLGGVGEFGMNMMLIASGDTGVLIDAGVMFPEPELFGVDLVLPDTSALDAYRGRIKALIVTHGHEDHIGGVAHMLDRVEGPIYGSRFTLALLRRKLAEHAAESRVQLIEVKPRERVEIGPFTFEFLRVTHSIPDSLAVAIHTPAGILLHTGDFKIDQTPPDGELFDLHRFAELGAEGVLALFSDSTNADRRGHTGSERDVVSGFEEILSGAQGKVLVTTFSSNMDRIQLLLDLAPEFDRKAVLLGRGMLQNTETAIEVGRLRVPRGALIRDTDIRDYDDDEILCLCTGSQGEAQAALTRIAIDDHRAISISPGDTVAFSARVIPGNEKAIARVMNHVARRGATVVTDADRHIHVSGHGSAEELKLVLALVKPRFFVPIHGEYRQLSTHARLASLVCPGVTVVMVEDGDVLRLEPGAARVVDRVPAGRVLIDGTRTGEIGDEVLRDRRHLAADGLVVPIVAISSQTGKLEQTPVVVTRGLAADARHEAMLAEAPELLARTIEAAPREERTDPGLLKERIRQEMQRLFRKRAGRRPLVLPVVMEV
jgi:ribonuclease J